MPFFANFAKNFIVMTRLGRLALAQPSVLRVIRQVRNEKLTYLGYAALLDLYGAAKSIEKRGIPGILVEAGSALGGSALVIAAAKSASRPLFLYDTFEMIPPPSAADGPDAHQRYHEIRSGKSSGIGGEAYYGYQGDLYERVINNFNSYKIPVETNSIALKKGLFQDTMQITQPVSFAHIDCDWYDSVMTCLCSIEPNLSPGAVMVIDDYFAWSGCRKAVDEYFSTRRDEYAFQLKSRLHIVKRDA